VAVGAAAREGSRRLVSPALGRALHSAALSQRGGELFDLVTVRLMIVGLRERVRES
jgi:hypothetical protein